MSLVNSNSTPSSAGPSSSAPLKKRMTNGMYLNSHSNSHNNSHSNSNSSPQRDNEQVAAAALASLCSKPKSPPSFTSESSSDDTSAPSTPIPSTIVPTATTTATTDTQNGYLSSSDCSTASVVLPRPVHAPPVSSMMVDHTYRDYSCVEETMLETLDAVADGAEDPPKSIDLSPQERKLNARKLRRIKSMFTDAGNVRKNSGGVTKPFPEKLMEVLSRGDIDTIIQWLPHGRAFIVLNPQVFVKEVLPRFFKQSKFMSFTRQLNLWGFKRITKGRDAGAYYHQLFLRGRARLCMRMRRQKIKGTGIKLTPNPETEPNFYKISEDAPLPAMEQKKEYEPLPPLRKVGNSNTNTNSATQHHSNVNAVRKNNANVNAMNVPFDYASLLSGMDRNGRGVGVVSSNVNRQMQHAMPQLTQPHRRVSAPPSLGTMHMPDPRRLSNSSNGSMASRMDLLSPSAHDRSRSAVAAAALRSSAHSGGFNAAAAVANPHGLLQDIRGMDRNVTADQRLSAAQELELLAQSLREKAAADKQQQTIVSAQRLLSQMSDPRKPPSPRSVEQLKSHLLAAAHSLDSVTAAPTQEPNLHSRQGAGGHAHAHSHFNPMQQLPRHRQPSSVDPYNSLLQQQHQQQQHRVSQQQAQAHSNADPIMNQIPNALMSALDQTKMVAAAAQEQSALLQRFAQNLEMRRQNGGGADVHGGLYNPHGRPHM